MSRTSEDTIISLNEPSFARLIDGYRPIGGAIDEMLDASGGVRAHWRTFLEELAALGPEGMRARFGTADRYLREAGVFHRVYDEEGGEDHAWPLSHMPILIPDREWKDIEAGLIERAELLEAVLGDVYSRQALIADGALPASLIGANGEFLRPLVGALPSSAHHLWIYGADLGRGPDGRWWVLGDRAQAPSGLGYAVENRVALSRALPYVYRRLNVERVAGFFDEFRGSLAAMNRHDGVRVGLLSPGRHNETYFEHAYLARYLGFLLVEGEDLTVREDVAYVRTVGGLRPIDVLLRRMDSAFADPLELYDRSRIGVPGLVRAVRAGHLTIANALGSGLMEAPAMLGFMPRLAERLLGRGLALPNVATWWCGQPNEREHVLRSFDNLAIGAAYRSLDPDTEGFETGQALIGAELNEGQRAAVLAAIDRRGMDFIGQELVRLSTTPVWHEGRLEPRPFVLRAFVARTEHGWKVMPGAFCRVSHGRDARAISMQHGGLAADCWVLSDGPVAPITLLPTDGDTSIRRLTGALPSRTADNFYWLGRYVERVELMLRVLRAFVLRAGGDLEGEDSARRDLLDTLLAMGVITPRQAGEGELAVMRAGFATPAAAGSLPDTVRSALHAASRVRDRLSPFGWQVLCDLSALFDQPLGQAGSGDAEVLERIHAALRTVAAFSGIAQENMNRLLAWRFLDLGRRLERAINTCRLALRFSRSEGGAKAGATSLDVLLRLVDSTITYRQRYSIATSVASVLDLVMLDANNPRSVAFQAHRIVEHLAALPDRRAGDLSSEVEMAAMRLQADLATGRASQLDADRLRALEQGFGALSGLVSSFYLADRAHRAQPLEPL